jgi:hypothetical protein
LIVPFAEPVGLKACIYGSQIIAPTGSAIKVYQPTLTLL